MKPLDLLHHTLILLLAIYGSDRRVTMHSFSRVVAWFGYFFLEQLADKIADEVLSTSQST